MHIQENPDSIQGHVVGSEHSIGIDGVVISAAVGIGTIASTYLSIEGFEIRNFIKWGIALVVGAIAAGGTVSVIRSETHNDK